MTWVFQSAGLPHELCRKISLYVRKPRHAITQEMLQRRLFMIEVLAYERRLQRWFDFVIYSEQQAYNEYFFGNG